MNLVPSISIAEVEGIFILAKMERSASALFCLNPIKQLGHRTACCKKNSRIPVSLFLTLGTLQQEAVNPPNRPPSPRKGNLFRKDRTQTSYPKLRLFRGMDAAGAEGTSLID